MHARLPWQRDLRYGDAPRACLDFIPAAQISPQKAKLPGLLVFIHGGYWQALSKNESAFLAPAWIDAGFAHAVLGYTLAPHATVGEIAAQCCDALRYLVHHAQSLGFDAGNIVVAGSSAGAYLAAACGARSGVPLRGIVPVSGVFDLAPLMGTSINDALQLDAAQAEALNLMRDELVFPPAVVAWGEIETGEFKRQSQAFAYQLMQKNTLCQMMEISTCNHFDVIFALGDPTSRLFAATRALFNEMTTYGTHETDLSTLS